MKSWSDKVETIKDILYALYFAVVAITLVLKWAWL